MTDQNGTTHDYAHDNLGREISDTVTHFGNSSVSQSVDEITYGYDVQGNLSTVTSYSESGDDPAGTVVNEDYMTYNDTGLLANDYQNPSGGISINSSTGRRSRTARPSSDTPTTSPHGYRLTSMEYPDGREIFLTTIQIPGARRRLEPRRLDHRREFDPGRLLTSYPYLRASTRWSTRSDTCRRSSST